MNWDTSSVNNGCGINQWGESTYSDGTAYEGADLMLFLNEKYLNKQDVENSCYDWETQEYGICNFGDIGMNSKYKGMIENVVWNTGAINIEDPTILDETTMSVNTVEFYNAERGTLGKTCTDGDNCNDNVTRMNAWEGLVALPYSSDYAYATSEKVCHTNMLAGLGDTTTSCMNNNWMHYGTSVENWDEITWTLSPAVNTNVACGVHGVWGGGMVGSISASQSLRVRPTLYLKSNVQIDDGDGSSGSPYKLKLDE